MTRTLITLTHYATYRYASVVRGILADQFAHIRELDEFYGDDAYLGLTTPFARRSAFHHFIAWTVDRLAREEFSDVDLGRRQRDLRAFADIPEALRDIRPTVLPIDEGLAHHDLLSETFEDWLRARGRGFLDATEADVEEYHEELYLSQEYESLVARITDEVFFVLFQDRSVLMLFNDMIARQVERSSLDEVDPEFRPRFARAGFLRRARIPEWARRAVYFRDRGRCVICRGDLSGTLSLRGVRHFDHIVALASGGLNDVSNLQLLCERCNLKKRDNVATTSRDYEAWYDMQGE